ncbi:hypothetical protein [Methanopyrus kandleri]
MLVYGWRAVDVGDLEPYTLLAWTATYDGPRGRCTFVFCLSLGAETPWVPPYPDVTLDGLLGTSTSLLTALLTRALGVPPYVFNRPVLAPRLPERYALVGLAACLTALVTRHYLGPLIYATLGVFVPEGFLTGVPLALWGLRLIAAGTGLPLPLVGALAWLLQWVFDENEEPDVVSPSYWILPRVVLSKPPTWYLERALESPDTLLDYLLTGAVVVSLPLPLTQLVWVLLGGPTGVLEILDYLVQLIEEIMEDPGRTLPEVILWFLLPVLPHVVHVPTWLAALGGLPALLAHAGGLLLAPHFLTHAPRGHLRGDRHGLERRIVSDRRPGRSPRRTRLRDGFHVARDLTTGVAPTGE